MTRRPGSAPEGAPNRRRVTVWLAVALASTLLLAGGIAAFAQDRTSDQAVAGVTQPLASAAPTGSSLAPSTSSSDRTTPPTPSPSALEAVRLLRVAGRAPMTGYDRDLFGFAWKDMDRNGCDTRNDILRRDLTGLVVREGTAGCLIASGTLNDPYSGRTILFVRGEVTSILVQIDHIVALADAWQKGAQTWTQNEREEFANDPLNLLAVDGSLNEQKGAGDTATWLPPNKPYRCEYVARQVTVKLKYDLSVTAAEGDAMTRILSGCPQQPLVTD